MNPLKYYADNVRQNKIKRWKGFAVVWIIQQVLTLLMLAGFYIFPEMTHQFFLGSMLLVTVLEFFYGFVFYYWNTLSGRIVLALHLFVTVVYGLASYDYIITILIFPTLILLGAGYGYAKWKFPEKKAS